MALGATGARYGDWKFTHSWVTDIDEDSCRTIQQIVDPSKVLKRDVRNLGFDRLPPIDGLVFGFPCNDFSVVGERRGIRGEYGALYRFGRDALESLNPRFFVAENVSGLSSINKKGDFDQIIMDLSNAGEGYKVVENLYKFEEYGIPQRRHRYFLVGFRLDTGITFDHPQPTKRTVTAREALSELPDDVPNNERTLHTQRVIDRLNLIQPGENVFNANLTDELQLQMRSGATISQIYRRLLPDEPSYTVTGSGGGGTHLYHWEEPRALTNRERARLQTFPDWYKFQGGKESVRRQVGMAVPPDGARLVFQKILETIGTVPKAAW
jgi:DNA (cytosine-5)-methyltransferase 1